MDPINTLQNKPSQEKNKEAQAEDFAEVIEEYKKIYPNSWLKSLIKKNPRLINVYVIKQLTFNPNK
jgi:hypothetical protein